MKPKRRKFHHLRFWTPFLVVAMLTGWFLRDGLIPGWGSRSARDFTATLEGRVVTGPRNQPLPGAEIRVGDMTATSDATGSFSLTHEDFIGRRLHVSVTCEGYRKRVIKPRMKLPAMDLGSIHLKREYIVTGTVVSRDLSAPIPATTVRVERAPEDGPLLAGVTNVRGRYRLGPVLEGAPFTLTFEHPAYLPVTFANQVLGPGRAAPPDTVVLAVGGVISGETRASGNRILQGVHIMVCREQEDGSAGAVEKAGLSGPDGTFLIQGLFPGRKVVLGESPDGSLRAAPVHVRVPEGGELVGIKLIFLSYAAQ